MISALFLILWFCPHLSLYELVTMTTSNSSKTAIPLQSYHHSNCLLSHCIHLHVCWNALLVLGRYLALGSFITRSSVENEWKLDWILSSILSFFFSGVSMKQHAQGFRGSEESHQSNCWQRFSGGLYIARFLEVIKTPAPWNTELFLFETHARSWWHDIKASILFLFAMFVQR